MAAAMLSFTVLSLNIWDLPIPLPGVNHRWRRQQLLHRLPELDADIILIQEAFRPEFKLEIKTALSGYFADGYLTEHRRRWGITFDGSGGLLTLSRWPVIWSHYLPALVFPQMSPDERLAAKGCLLTAIDAPAGRVAVGNVHLYAGMGPRSGRARALQGGHLLEALSRHLHDHRDPLLLGGDFNMAVETERVESGFTGFDLLHQAGFREVANGTSGRLATVVQSRNRYARYWPGRRPDRRLSHLFYRGPGLRPANGGAWICFDDPPVSDHFGFMASLELDSAAKGSAADLRPEQPAVIVA